MKTAGLLGGMSYESTIQYYKLINKKINNRLGNLNSAKILLYSICCTTLIKIITFFSF